MLTQRQFLESILKRCMVSTKSGSQFVSPTERLHWLRALDDDVLWTPENNQTFNDNWESFSIKCLLEHFYPQGILHLYTAIRIKHLVTVEEVPEIFCLNIKPDNAIVRTLHHAAEDLVTLVQSDYRSTHQAWRNLADSIVDRLDAISEADNLDAIGKNYHLAKYIPNPSDAVQLATIYAGYDPKNWEMPSEYHDYGKKYLNQLGRLAEAADLLLYYDHDEDLIQELIVIYPDFENLMGFWSLSDLMADDRDRRTEQLLKLLQGHGIEVQPAGYIDISKYVERWEVP